MTTRAAAAAAALLVTLVALSIGASPSQAAYPCGPGYYTGASEPVPATVMKDRATTNWECVLFHDSGTESIGRLATQSWGVLCNDATDLGDPMSNYLYAHIRSSTSVSIASSDTSWWDSGTYTNWSISTTHSYRSQVLCDSLDSAHLALEAATQPIVPPPAVAWAPPPAEARASGLRSHEPQRAVRAVVDPLPERHLHRAVAATGTTILTGSCEAGEEVSEAEAHLTGGGRKSSSQRPTVQVSGRSVKATVRDAGSTRGKTLYLHFVCAGERDQRIALEHGKHLVVAGKHGSSLRLRMGDERAFGSARRDVITATSGKHVVWGGAGADVLRAGTGEDVLQGGTGDDRLVGGTGKRDMLVGGPGRNSYSGGPADDYINALEGTVRGVIRCGRGHDRVLAPRGTRVARDCETVVLR
jgi:RTX calcium-binding nonapeptide repeat (4 copies)